MSNSMMIIEAEGIQPLSSEKPQKKTRKGSKKDDEFEIKERLLNGKTLCVTKPSYNLQRGRGSLATEFRSLRHFHRNRLFQILPKFVRRHNWDEAAGVLSVLSNVTCNDKSELRNHIKYLAAMELLKQTHCESINQKKFQLVFETWMKKMRKAKGSETKGRFEVQLEFIMYCLTHRKTEDAKQAVIGLMQECDFRASPLSNLVFGLAIGQEWYVALSKEFSTIGLSGFCAPNQAEMSEPALNMSIVNFGSHVADEFQEDNYTVPCNSDTSVRNDKDIGCNDANQHQELSMNVDLHRETPHRIPKPQSFYVHSSESDGYEELPFSGDGSILYAHGEFMQ